MTESRWFFGSVAVLVGLPLALWLGHIGRGGLLAVNISNVGRAVPTFAVLLFLAIGPVGSSPFGPYGRAGLATLVALVQTAGLLPMLLLALPAGVLADSFDRRRLLVAVQLLTFVVGAVLVVAVWLDGLYRKRIR